MRRIWDDFLLEFREEGVDAEPGLGERFVEDRIDDAAVDGREDREIPQLVVIAGGKLAYEIDGVSVLFGRKQEVVHVWRLLA